MNILHILNSAHGGSALSTFELITALASRGVRSSLVCFNNADGRQREQIVNLVEGRVLFIPLYWMNKRLRARWWKRPLLELRALYQTWGGYKFQPQIAALIRRNNINLVHTSTILNPEGAIAARRNRLPHVWHVRELIGPQNHFQFYNYTAWSKYVQTHCNVLIANSNTTKECLQPYFPAGQIRTIPNGIDVERFSPRVHQNRQSRVVAMLGSVTTRWKNHAFFIRVAHALRQTPNVLFRIYGSLPAETDGYYQWLRKLNEPYQTVEFVAFDRPENIMREIDVLFHPSLYESFGRIYAEAMAAGVPIVAVRAGSATELVEDGENGYLVPSDDVDLAAARILNLLESSELRNQMGARGRKKVLAEYSLTLLADRMTGLYEKLIKESGGQVAP